MCLKSATQYNSIKKIIGYKVFKICTTEYGRDVFFSLFKGGNKEYHINHTYNASHKLCYLNGLDGNIYFSGFHVLETYEDALKYYKYADSIINGPFGRSCVYIDGSCPDIKKELSIVMVEAGIYAKGIDESGINCYLANYITLLEVMEKNDDFSANNDDNTRAEQAVDIGRDT